MPLHIIKLCVGADTVDDLRAWHRDEMKGELPWVVRTRMTPKRAAEVLDGGSIYRVFKGMVLCRQKILAIDTVGEGVAARCQITVSPDIVLTQPLPRRPFQGWRYFEHRDAPEDLANPDGGEAVPQELARALRELGAW